MAVRPPAADVACALAALLAHAGCGGGTPVTPLDREALLDPDACKTCHPVAYQEWSGSMHAYASDDPVFRAMNQRAQRETSGALGDFCVKCHAPMAVADGDDDRRPQPGHAAAEDEGRDLLLLPRRRVGRRDAQQPADAGEGRHACSVRSPIRRPATPHKGVYSRLLDGATLESASMCGSCHDIQNLQGAHVERTFEEWQGTLFATPPNGQGCAELPHEGAR